jgi:hypothetical protein
MSDRGEFEVYGERLLSAVERIVEDCDGLIAAVEAFRLDTIPTADEDESDHRAAVADRIIASYASKSTVAGGASALPGLLPGGGTIIAVTAGAMVDMTLMLKHEVEMALCLTHLYDHDIRDEKERWLAYALVAVNIYEAKAGQSYVQDLAEAQLEAFALYTPRQLTKLVITLLGKIGLLALSKSFARALPFVGIVVGAAANRVLTRTVGRRCAEALERRRNVESINDAPIIDARVAD